MNVKKGVKNIAYAMIGQIIALGLGIIVPRIVIVSYGSEVNGLLTSVSQIITYLTLLEAGVGSAALQALYKPISEMNTDSINSILSATHSYYRRTGVIYFLLSVALSFAYPIIVNTTLDYWFVVAIVLICGIPNVINYFFQGKLKILLSATGDNYIVTNLATITSTLATVSKILLLLAGSNVIFVQLVYCAVSLVQMLFIYLFVRKKYPWVNVRVKPDLEALKQKNSTLLHQICVLITNSTDVLLLSIFCDLKVASIYAVYNMVFSIVYNMSNSINGGVQFILGNAFCKGREYYKRVIDFYESYYMGICSALMTITYIMILPFLKLYIAGADIDYIDFWVPILFTAIELLRAMRNSSVNTISVAGHFKQTSNYAVIESTINLSVSLALIMWLGIYGVLIGTVVAFTYRNIVSIHYSNKQILGRSSAHSIKIAFTNIALIVLLGFAAGFVKIEITGYGMWVLYAIIVSICSFAMFLVVNSVVSPKSFGELVSYLKRKLLRKRENNIEKHD